MISDGSGSSVGTGASRPRASRRLSAVPLTGRFRGGDAALGVSSPDKRDAKRTLGLGGHPFYQRLNQVLDLNREGFRSQPVEGFGCQMRWVRGLPSTSRIVAS